MRQAIRDETDDDLDAIHYLAKQLRDLNETTDDPEATELILSMALTLNGLKQRALARKRRLTPAPPRRDG